MKKGESVLPSPLNFLSLLSDSNQRPRDYKSRAVGKLTTSRRYNQVPLLRSSPGGIPRELAV